MVSIIRVWYMFYELGIWFTSLSSICWRLCPQYLGHVQVYTKPCSLSIIFPFQLVKFQTSNWYTRPLFAPRRLFRHGGHGSKGAHPRTPLPPRQPRRPARARHPAHRADDGARHRTHPGGPWDARGVIIWLSSMGKMNNMTYEDSLEMTWLSWYSWLWNVNPYSEINRSLIDP